MFIRDLRIALVPGSGFRRIAIAVELSDRIDGRVDATIHGLVPTVAIPVSNGSGVIEIEAEPDLWAPETPILYAAEARFGSDLVRDRVGFREIARQNKDILLNGRPIYLRGICVHEDDAQLGRTVTEADLRRRFADLRALGCNFARLTHYPHHERTAQIADEEGLMLWAEIPVYWAIDFANPETFDDAANQLAELIRRDSNRASVVVWGVGNENADTNARLDFMARLAARARAQDPTRLVAAACLIDRTTFRIADRLASHLDIIGLNEYFGWYEPDFSGLERLLANSEPDRPVVVSETGADAVAGLHGAPGTLFTEEHQAEMHRRQLEILAGTPWIRGYCAWLLYDFRSDRRQTGLQRGWNRKGLIAEDKVTRKLAFGVLQAHYAKLRRQG